MTRHVQSLRWVAVIWIVVFWRLGYPGLMDPDEAHYAELTREMLRAGNWLVPLLDGVPCIDKPILFHWLQGAAFTVLGETEFAARVPGALAAIALFGTTRWLGRALFSAAVGEWGALMLATIPTTFALASIGIMDMVYTSFLFSGVAALLVAAREERTTPEIAGYVLLALAVMTKGPVAIALVGLLCASAWLAGGELRARIDRLHWKSGLMLATMAAAPWFVWMYARFGDAFVQGYVLAGNLYYLTQPASFSGRAVSHTFYLRALAAGFFPSSVLVLGRLGDLLLGRPRMQWSTDEKLLWLWSALVVGLFSIARFKLDHYIFPAAPAICLIAAKTWTDAASCATRSVRATCSSVMALGAGFVVAGAFTSVYIFELNLELPPSAIVLPFVLGIGGVAVLATMARANWRVPVTPAPLIMTMLCIYGVIVAVGFPTLEHTKPTALLARTLYARTPSDAPAAIYNLEQWRPSLRYYAQRPLAPLSTLTDVVKFTTSSQQPVYIFMRRREYRALRQAGVELREVFKCRAVVGTIKARSGMRRQQWGEVIIVTNARSANPWLP